MNEIYSIEFIADAEEELSDAFDWYEEKKPGLGDRFYNEITRHLSIIESNPFTYACKYGHDLHFASLKIFPFLIVYWINKKTDIIYVISIFHTSRNPKKFWRQ